MELLAEKSTRLPSQSEMVLKYLKEVGHITDMEAREHLNISRLAARIHDLRDEGYTIVSHTLRYKSRDGRHKRITKYFYENFLPRKGEADENR